MPVSGEHGQALLKDGGKTQLSQELASYQILLIVLSGLIGTGVFVTNVEALELSGPLGLFCALGVLGVIIVCIGETVSHLVQLFPTPNAIYEYVYHFVDRELAWVVGVAYWYAWASVFAIEMLEATAIAQFWNSGSSDNYIVMSVAFYVITPLVLVVLNYPGVQYFGWVETAGGGLKVSLVFALCIGLWVVAGEENSKSPGISIDENNRFGASFCMALPLVAWSFGGIEATTIAAFEARSIKDISWASSSVHWFTVFLYLLYTVAVMLVVPSVGRSFIFSVHATSVHVVDSVDVLGHRSLAGFINGFFLYSVLSCGNTALYMASRTLYGLTSNERLARRHDLLSRCIQYLGMINPLTGVPLNAVIFSWLIFCWVPLLGFAQSGTLPGLAGIKQFFFVTSSMAYVVVWAALCVAFIRFRHWANKCATGLENQDAQSYSSAQPEALLADHYQRYVSTGSHRMAYQRFIRHIIPQPLAAYIGLLGCALLVITSSAVWWDESASQVSPAWSASVYLLEVLLLLFWAGLKARNRQWKTWWVRQDEDVSNPTELIGRIDKLYAASDKGARRGEIQNVELEARGQGHLQHPASEDTRSYSVQGFDR